MAKKLLVINPGSTSTKIAVYEDNIQKWVENISHSPEELEPFSCVYDQLNMRYKLIVETLKKHDETTEGNFDAVVSRGGLLPPVSAGAYEVNEYMLDCLEHRPQDQHPSNVGAGIAYKIAQKTGVKAYVYDPVTVDEMLPVFRITGLKGIRRPARGHNLNMRAAALKLCGMKSIDYHQSNIIIVHLGGGISLSLHSRGRIIDMISDDEGPMSPERAGGLPHYDLIKMAYSGKYTYAEFMKMIQRKGGMVSHFGTANMREIERRINLGDREVQLVFDAMALSVAKNIAKLSADVAGKVDYIVLTGGIAYSKLFTDEVTGNIEFIAPVVVIPGENEMEALALGILRVLNGEEEAKKL